MVPHVNQQIIKHPTIGAEPVKIIRDPFSMDSLVTVSNRLMSSEH